MKKIIFICAVTLGMLSCSSEQANVKDAEEVSVLKIENVQRINSDEELQKVAYRLLNENEKFVFWKDRFDLLLQEDEFTSSQKQLISELQNNLTVSLFSDIINDDQEYFKNIYIPHFLERAQNEFTFNEIDGIFYSARTFHFLTQNPGDGGGGGGVAQGKIAIVIKALYLDVGLVKIVEVEPVKVVPLDAVSFGFGNVMGIVNYFKLIPKFIIF